MKLATYRDGSRDGQLVVVSRDLATAHYANGIATRLQQVLDDWSFLSPQLEDLSATLNHGKARHAFAFDERMCMAPLPRAAHWACAQPYLPFAARVEGLDDAALSALRSDPRVAPGSSDGFVGACDDIAMPPHGGDLDFAAGFAVVTGDIAAGAPPAQALEGVRLLALVNAWTLPAVAAAERAKGMGFAQAALATAFSPVAVTPDELGDAWQAGKVHLSLQVALNGRKLGVLDAAADMHFHFGQLLAHAARTRGLRAGAVLGAAPVAQADATRGHAGLADQRAAAAGLGDAPPWMQPGDRVRIEVKGRDGHSVFGAIDQTVGEPA